VRSSDENAPANACNRTRLHVAVQSLLAMLTPERREAFVLTQLVGLPYADAAEVCGVPVGTIRSRVARARDDLRTGLDEEAV
jgi:RNA polymerase sigma-70 factor, ECF subfamily